jgi:ribosomal protein S18 acetylase RimI-like enzyme
MATDMKDINLKYWTTPPNMFLVATRVEEPDRIIGMAAMHQVSEVSVELSRIFVRKEARRRGLARLLSQRLIEAAKEMEGVDKVVLGTTDSQTPAIALYESMGFERQQNMPFESLPEWTVILHGLEYRNYLLHLDK